MLIVALCAGVQPGDVALFVPSSLIVTLERVLGDETIGKGQAGAHCVMEPMPTFTGSCMRPALFLLPGGAESIL